LERLKTFIFRNHYRILIGIQFTEMSTS